MSPTRCRKNRYATKTPRRKTAVKRMESMSVIEDPDGIFTISVIYPGCRG
jgi:hypothetical protein